MARRAARPLSPNRATRFNTLDELLTAVLDTCRAELGQADTEYTETLEAAYLKTDESLSPLHTFSRAVAQAARANLGSTDSAPSFKTPLAKLLERHPDESSRKVALRAILAGYVPSLTHKPGELTVAEVIATTHKAVDAIRKASKPASFPHRDE